MEGYVFVDAKRGFSGRYVVLAALFVTCLIVANIIAVKILALPFGLFAPAGVVIFPLSYLFGDVLTEVYGYAAARRVIWLAYPHHAHWPVQMVAAAALPPLPPAPWRPR